MEATKQFLKYVVRHSKAVAGIIDDIKNSVTRGEILPELKERIDTTPVPPQFAKYQNWDALKKELITDKVLIYENDAWGIHSACLTDDTKDVLSYFNTIATSISSRASR